MSKIPPTLTLIAAAIPIINNKIVFLLGLGNWSINRNIYSSEKTYAAAKGISLGLFIACPNILGANMINNNPKNPARQLPDT